MLYCRKDLNGNKRSYKLDDNLFLRHAASTNIRKFIFVCLFLGRNTPWKKLKKGKTRHEYCNAENKGDQVTE